MTEKTSYIPTRIKNAAKGGHVTGVEDIIDDASGKTQKEINAAASEEIAEIKGGSTETIATLNQKIATEQGRAQGAEQGLNNRLSTVEELAEISISGGDIGIATADDFDNPTAEQRAKVPTVGALLDGADDEPTAGSDNLVKSNGVEYSSHFADFVFTPLNKNSIGFTSNQNGSVDVAFKRASYICITDNGRHNFMVTRPSESINIPSAYTLVYDFTDSAVKVVALNNTTFAQPPILLAMVNNGIIERGVFVQAWYEQKIDANKESITEVNDNVGFGDYAIYPSYKSAVYGEVNVADQSVNMVFTRNAYIVISSKGNTQQFNISVPFEEGETSKTYNVQPQQALVYNRVTSALEVVGLNNVNYSKDCIILLSNSSNYRFSGYFAANVNDVYQPLIGKGVLFIGDSITEYAQGDQSVQNHFIDEFQKMTGCVIYNRGAAGTTIANYKDGDTSPQYSFCGVNSFCGRMQKTEDNTLNFVNNGGFPNASRVDLVIMFGGTNDWCRRTTHQGSFGDVNGAINQTTYCGAIRYMLRMLKYKYSPKCPILVLSPMHIFSATQGQEHWNEIIYNGNGSESNSYTIQKSITTGSIGKSLYDYIDVLQELSRLYGCHFVNMQDVGFTSVIAQDRNAFTYDGLHPNNVGGKIMAQYILDAIKSKISL